MPEQVKTRQYLSPFKLEVATETSSSVHVKSLSKTYRGRWSRHKLGAMSASIGSKMGMMPDIPGIQFIVIPKENKVTIFDPLSEDQDLLDKISSVWHGASLGIGANFKAVKAAEVVLDDDKFVTLLHELKCCVEKDEPVMHVISGTFPTNEQIASLPGRELNEVGSPYPHAKYKDEVDKHRVLLDAMAEKGIVI